MPAATITPGQALQALDASNTLLARNQGPELFASGSIDLTNGQTITPNPLNVRRPISDLIIRVRFRVAVTVANLAQVGCEAPQNVLQKILLQGTHAAFGSQTLWNVSGASAFVYPRLFNLTGGQVLINDVLAGSPGQPVTSPFLGTTAGSPYDVELSYHLPMHPFVGIGQQTKKQQSAFLLMGGDWGDTLQLQLTFGDKSTLGDATGSTVAISGYGGTGSPTYEVHVCYSILGDLKGAFQNRSGITLRNESFLTGFTSTGTNMRLQQLQKKVTTNVIVKSGIIETTLQSPGVFTFETLTDRQLDATQIVVDNKPIRNNVSNVVSKSWISRQFGVNAPQGYFVLSFVDSNNVMTAYRGDRLDAGVQFDLNSNIVSANAAARQTVIQETILGGPYS
jgi:hypothetical protein